MFGTCIWLYGVTCENSINRESYLNRSWDNKRPGVVSDAPQKVTPSLECPCHALRTDLFEMPSRLLIGFGPYDLTVTRCHSVRAGVCHLNPLSTWPHQSVFCTTASIPFQQSDFRTLSCEKMQEAHGPLSGRRLGWLSVPGESAMDLRLLDCSSLRFLVRTVRRLCL